MQASDHNQTYDIAIVGGGINGCGIARDAAGRGLSVYLCEKDDLASGTSSASTKLIHGGLRYLEHYEFRLVREALIEREVLWKLAPHIVWPLRFVLPHHSGLRPAWLLRLGLFMYDHLGGRKLLPATQTIDLKTHIAGKPLKPGYGKAFEYSDCWVEDSRLVVLNAMDARARGARIETRTELVSAQREQSIWNLNLRNTASGAAHQVKARILVNAAGPWAGEMLAERVAVASTARVRLVQGSHIVVKRMFEHDRCYIFQNADNRIIFAIPYERDFTLIGTTDLDFKGKPGKVEATPSEIAYLCDAASEYFTEVVTPTDVIWTYSGVRPLYDDGASKAQEATRDYVLNLDGEAGAAPLLSIFGGKITTFRRLAEAAMEKLSAFVPPAVTAKSGWTGSAGLPGGDFATDGFAAQVTKLQSQAPFLTLAHATRLVRAYGTFAFEIVGGATSLADMGQNLGSDLTLAEVDYVMDREWAMRAEDVLWRRSKLGLRVSAEQAQNLDAYMVRRGDNSGRVTAVARVSP